MLFVDQDILQIPLIVVILGCIASLLFLFHILILVWNRRIGKCDDESSDSQLFLSVCSTTIPGVCDCDNHYNRPRMWFDDRYNYLYCQLFELYLIGILIGG